MNRSSVAVARARVATCIALATALVTVAHAQAVGEVKISATEGGIQSGLDPGDLFGFALCATGDVDGDGIQDITVGAPKGDAQGTDRGEIWTLFLNPDATVRDWQKINSGQGQLTGPLEDNDQFGSALAAVGDMDGNGVPDIVVGAYKDDDGDSNAGAVYVLQLKPTGRVRNEQKISMTAGGFVGPLGSGDSFGTSVARIGDLDGDGVVDIAVGAPQHDGGGPDRGAVWILFLNEDGTVKAEQKIAHDEGGFPPLLADGDRFGEALAPLDDLNDDGVLDLAVGANADNDGGNKRGAVWLLFLNPDGTVKSQEKISSTQGSFEGPLADTDRFGSSIAYLGAIDAGPWPVIAVGAKRTSDGGNARGAIWLLSLEPDGDVVLERKISDTAGGFGGDLSDNDSLGQSLAMLDDKDGNGFDELVAGAHLDDDGGGDTGAVWTILVGDLATVALRPGAGVNDLCYFSVNLPVLGSMWFASVLAIQQPGATSSVIIGFAEPFEPGLLTAYGELVVDPTTSFELYSTRPVAGSLSIHSIPIASQIGLVGRTIYTQAAILGGGPVRLCNGLDVTLGY